ncbi:Alpha-1,6-mannosylglycoprotein 6-beta-N-acetylglucosaminyltransferase A [Oryzias melastigma]|uniref:Alpha-1,6-mannosylglycoprotein 6-beta-N-acetylglucosaminyltransferase A n=1 Tax=Oryzias melastigma TaxID=30732 RepID=A0A834CW48_ORYME|nr:Alpha-1,6-mannosylglycoprotein 6-beta-N-acetylglucosaminyltransferase A [Oryzias melastigma]
MWKSIIALSEACDGYSRPRQLQQEFYNSLGGSSCTNPPLPPSICCVFVLALPRNQNQRRARVLRIPGNPSRDVVLLHSGFRVFLSKQQPSLFLRANPAAVLLQSIWQRSVKLCAVLSDKQKYLDIIHSYMEVHGTVHGTSNAHLPGYVKNHGNQNK